VDGTLAAFDHQKPFQLWKAILFFLDMVEGQWFDSEVEIMNEEKRRELIQKARGQRRTHRTDGRRFLRRPQHPFGMADSPLWRPHIPIKLWSVMGGFPGLPETTPRSSGAATTRT
jgi:hypothetical protein